MILLFVRGRQNTCPIFEALQKSAKERYLGCVNQARGSQEAGITQPRDHSLADPCITQVHVNIGLHLSSSESELQKSFVILALAA